MSLTTNKYSKGKFKLKGIKDENGDYPKDFEGNYLSYEENDDLYIHCNRPSGSMIWSYGINNKFSTTNEVFVAYFPKGNISNEVIKALGKNNVLQVLTGDSETEVYFLDKHLDTVATIMKAVTRGASVMPYKIAKNKKATTKARTKTKSGKREKAKK